jgi:hypothetical protein
MAEPSMDVTSSVGKLLEEDDVELLREGVWILAQALMETEVSRSEPGPMSGARPGPPTEAATGPGPGTRGSEPSG